MPTLKVVQVSYHKATRHEYGHTVEMSLRNSLLAETFYGLTMQEIVEKATLRGEELAKQNGHGYSLVFSVAQGARKPAGFDKLTQRIYVGT